MKAFLSRLGPGMLYAGAAVGVSHLVQSTRAGAEYGWIMILVVLFANVLKYPFFKAGTMYAMETSSSILDGFKKVGWWGLPLFFVISIASMFTTLAVVCLLTSSILTYVFGLNIAIWQVSLFVLTVSMILLIVGKFNTLNKFTKWVVLLLSVSSLCCLIASFFAELPVNETPLFDYTDKADLFFLVALIGWMPAPLEISIWQSEWTIEEMKNSAVEKNYEFDFKIGYTGTTLLAVVFVLLGSNLLGGSSVELSSNGAEFSGQLIEMYTTAIGNWSFPIVSIAALCCMFSTTLTVFDAYPRVLDSCLKSWFPKKKLKYAYTFLLCLLFAGAMYILVFQLNNMKQLVNLATSISFVTAPLLGILIFLALRKNKDVSYLKVKSEKVFALLGLIFLTAFAIYFAWLKLV